MKTIEIVVSLEGETQIVSSGFAGRECLVATRAFEAALGRTVGDRLTSEFYQTAIQPNAEELVVGGDRA